MDHEPIVEIVDVTKRFGSTIALQNVTMTVSRGTVHGLVGRNGAGKSTLVGLLAGEFDVDGGRITFRSGPSRSHVHAAEHLAEGGCGTAVVPDRLTAASPRWRPPKCAVVYQKGKLLPEMTVADNLVLSQAVGAGRAVRLIRWERVRRETEAIMKAWGMPVRAETRVGDLPMNIRQMIEIAGALALGAPLLVLDEPTAALGGRRERAQLFERVRLARDTRDVGVIFISHYLQEIFELCDVVTVLRDGRVVASNAVNELNERELVQLMVGMVGSGETGKEQPASERLTSAGFFAGGAMNADASGEGAERQEVDRKSECLVELSGLVPDGFSSGGAGVTARLRPGESLGFVSAVGGGAIAVSEVLVGARKAIAGQVRVGNVLLPSGDPSAALSAGVASVPPDRHSHGIVGTIPLFMNASLQAVVKRRLGRWLRRRQELRMVESVCDLVGVVRGGPLVDMDALSGGNQQKVMVARALASGPEVLVLANPSVGVDVASRRDIYDVLGGLSRAGISVIIASEDELEDAFICDRVLAIKDGDVVGVFDGQPRMEDVLAAIEGLATGSHSARGERT